MSEEVMDRPLTTDEKLSALGAQLDYLEDGIKKIHERMDGIEAIIGKTLGELKPMVDELLNSGLGRMLMIGKKK